MNDLKSITNSVDKQINKSTERIRKYQELIQREKEKVTTLVRVKSAAQNKKSKYEGTPKDLSVKDEQ